jgi:hypothetical protein
VTHRTTVQGRSRPFRGVPADLVPQNPVGTMTGP